MNPVLARLFLCGLIAAPSLSNAADEDLAAAREKLMGPVIATGPDYTVHSPQAVRTGNAVRCAVQGGNAMSDEAFNARLNAIREAAAKEQEPLDKEETALMNARRARPPMSDQEFAPKWKSLQARKEEIASKARAEDKKLQDEWANSRRSSSNTITLYLQHAPLDPNATIVPLEGIAPSSAFVAEFSRIMRPFLSTCPDSDWVSAAHYYRDAIPFGLKVTQAQLDPHIIAFRYILRAGNLSLNKAPEYFGETQRINNDPARNPRLTLAGLHASNQALSIETDRRNAAYRKDFKDPAKRQQGIVYKLDPYWTRYRKPELARRIFDGDFGMGEKDARYIHGGAKHYRDSTEFRILYFNYADLYSGKCKAHVQSWVTFAHQTSENHRSELDPITGVFVPKSDPKTVTYQIDARFAEFYQRYKPDVLNAMMSRTLGQMKQAERGERKRFSEMTTSDFSKTLKQATSEMLDMDGILLGFFDSHSCTSATMAQMGENILRAAEDRPSAQEEGVRYPGAEQESDPPQ